jgi:glycosyltransferase involved in cell wall biosynthesis
MAALLLAGQPRAPLFWTVFSTDSIGPRVCLRSRVVRRVSALLSRWVTAVIYNAEEARDYHRRIGFRERRSVVLSNVIDPEAFRHDRRQRGALRAALAIGADAVVVGVVGRVVPMKDWRTVQLAVRDLTGVVTVAIGAGTSELPPQAGFIGLGWQDDVAAVLSASDIFLLGSAFGEGTSLALGEAMLCGLPCVVTDVGGNAALAGDGGIVVQPRDPEAIRDAILQLVRDRTRREAIGRTARTRGLAAVSRDDSFRRLHHYSLGGEI